MTRCTNAEPGTFNHECGRPATWAGTRRSGHVQNFCDRCRAEGWERHGVVEWTTLDPDTGCSPDEDAGLWDRSHSEAFEDMKGRR